MCNTNFKIHHWTEKKKADIRRQKVIIWKPSWKNPIVYAIIAFDFFSHKGECLTSVCADGQHLVVQIPRNAWVLNCTCLYLITPKAYSVHRLRQFKVSCEPGVSVPNILHGNLDNTSEVGLFVHAPVCSYMWDALRHPNLPPATTPHHALKAWASHQLCQPSADVSDALGHQR